MKKVSNIKGEIIQLLETRPSYLKKGLGWFIDKYGLNRSETNWLKHVLKDMRNPKTVVASKPVAVEQTSKTRMDFKVSKVKSSKDKFELILISDLHSIFVDHDAFNCLLKVLKDNSFDELCLNGDGLDFPYLSRYDSRLFEIPILKNYSEIKEIEFTKNHLLKAISTVSKNPNMIKRYRLGNHEERLTEGKNKQAADRIAVLFKHYNSSSLDEMLSLKELNWIYDPSAVTNYFDMFDVVHGVSLAKAASRNNIFSFMSSGSSGDTHRLNSTYIRTKKGNFMWCESGCFRTLDDVEYIPTGRIVDWMQGFVTVTFDLKKGTFYAKTHPIINGHCEFNGKLY